MKTLKESIMDNEEELEQKSGNPLPTLIEILLNSPKSSIHSNNCMNTMQKIRDYIADLFDDTRGNYDKVHSFGGRIRGLVLDRGNGDLLDIEYYINSDTGKVEMYIKLVVYYRDHKVDWHIKQRVIRDLLKGGRYKIVERKGDLGDIYFDISK